MPDRKFLDERSLTRGGGVIRVEAWIDGGSKWIHRYNLAYVNTEIYSGDNGRVVGFDNRHRYPGFRSVHHAHWFGLILDDRRFVSFDQTLTRFERLLARLKRLYGDAY